MRFARFGNEVFPDRGVDGETDALDAVVEREIVSAGEECEDFDDFIGKDVAVVNFDVRAARGGMKLMVVPGVNELDGPFGQQEPFSVQTVFEFAADDEEEFVDVDVPAEAAEAQAEEEPEAPEEAPKTEEAPAEAPKAGVEIQIDTTNNEE